MIPVNQNQNHQFDLSKFSLNGKSHSMKKQMLEDKYILQDIAILGQWTVIYGPPNGGKTLITLQMIIDSIKKRIIKPEDIFYINADDTYKGFAEKLELAELYGFHMLQPGANGFDPNKFSSYIQQIISSGNAYGKIIFLDTLKKFTNLMDKSVGTEFGKVIRSFVGSGGSVVALAHVNKHKDALGKSIHSGTSDIKDDCDCCYVIDIKSLGANIKTVEYRNEKCRGDVAKTLTVQYSNESGVDYLMLMDSVQILSESKAEFLQRSEDVANLISLNKLIIETIESMLKAGISQKTELAETVHKISGASKAKIYKVLEQHAGTNWDFGHRWNYSVTGKNVHTYKLLSNKEE